MFKDTKDGQTHYQNDGCGEPEHNEMNKDQWKCECGETVTANGEHLCKNKIIDNAVRDICSVSVTAAPKSKVREILEVALSRTRSDALLEAVEVVEEAINVGQNNEYLSSEPGLKNIADEIYHAKQYIFAKLRKKINDPNDEIIQKILKDLPTLPEKMKRIDESKE